MNIDDVLGLVRPDIRALKAYSSARSLASDSNAQGGVETLYLDANESPVEPFQGSVHLNRYDSQQPPVVLERLAKIYGVEPDNIMMSRGSDEAIDVIIRTFCQPAGGDSILHTPPTFGMYAQYAAVNATRVISVPLDPYDFSLNTDEVLRHVQAGTHVKVVFLCSPNNPTGARIDPKALVDVIQKSNAIIVVDEAYIEYCDEQKLMQLLPFNPQLILLRTLSKARAMAGARLGCAIGAKPVIEMLRKVLPPYPMTRPAMDAVQRALMPENQEQLKNIRNLIIEERERMSMALNASMDVERVWPSATNFLLVQVKDPAKMMALATQNGIILRDMSAQIPRAIRVTLGLPEQNNRVLAAWGISVECA
jgi:histidinol-phosphate aminotransferase|tara:strand:- start:109317 stop:110411 length:1095 start_codon:yes stop_codon:yes gene_type:complete